MKRFLAVAFLLVFSYATFAQSVAILRGRVTDASGASVANASIKLTLVTTGAVREGTADSNGGYEFSQLQPGRYTLEASAPGFQTTRREALDLLVATTSTIDVTLGVESVKQEVLVTGEAAVRSTPQWMRRWGTRSMKSKSRICRSKGATSWSCSACSQA